MAVTWNPSDKAANITLSNGDLTAAHEYSAWEAVRATLSKASGKWYWEVIVGFGSAHVAGIGVSSASLSSYVGADANGYGYRSEDGAKCNSGCTSYGTSWSSGNIIGIALDLDNGKIWFSKNNVWQASGDPAAGTNEAFSGISGTFFPMHSLFSANAEITARFTSASQTYSPPSGFTALGDEAATEATNLLDGKIVIVSSATNLLDGKVIVDGLDTDLLDGKVVVESDGVNLLDGKVDVEVTATNLLDSKVIVASSYTSLLDGKIEVASGIIDLLDGKVIIASSSTSSLDGKVTVESDGINLLDGKVVVKNTATNLLDGEIVVSCPNIFNEELPIFEVEAYTGDRGDCSFPLFEVDGEASHWLVMKGSNSLPRLSAIGYTGAVYQGVLPSLSCEGEAVVGTVASGEIELPLFEVSAEALISIISSLEENLPSLRVNASSSGGVFVKGAAMLPPLHLVAEGLVGRLVSVEITLPSLEVTGELAHVPVGSGEMELPGLEMLAVANLLYSPEQGCHILRHSR